MKMSNPLERDPYSGVVVVLLVLALVGAVAAVAAGYWFANPVLLDVAVALGIATGVLGGVVLTQMERAKPASVDAHAVPVVAQDVSRAAAKNLVPAADALPVDEGTAATATTPAGPGVPIAIGRWFRDFENPRVLRTRTAAAGVLALAAIPLIGLSEVALLPVMAGIGAACCLVAAALAATAVRYLAEIDPVHLPEAPGLCRGARIIAWLLVLAAVSMVLEWLGLVTALRVLNVLVVAITLVVCYGLFVADTPKNEVVPVFPLDFGALSVLGGRTNVLASVLDAAQRQLGIDLRSTWALTIVRRSLEPLIVGLAVIGWLTTSLTVVGVAEQGLVERLGVPVAGEPLEPGIHVHWPWPIDEVFRIPVQRVQSLSVGHEGQEEGGPEDVLWARQHAANEYTLLLGNGRDLITIDAAVQFRITDPRAWRYNCQNPADALKAIAYRAVMRSTVNHTLAEALSENVVTTTGQMRAMVQQDADALRLGVTVVGFTVGGMHPPVMVAADYEKVVSAELGKVTAVVNAQAERNRIVPYAESAVLVGANAARAQGAQDLAVAAGEAWSFRTLESQYRIAPQDYFFRRRLETLEHGLLGRAFTVVDSRFERDGGVLWVNP